MWWKYLIDEWMDVGLERRRAQYLSRDGIDTKLLYLDINCDLPPLSSHTPISLELFSHSKLTLLPKINCSCLWGVA
jgi:hypothetical protein